MTARTLDGHTFITKNGFQRRSEFVHTIDCFSKRQTRFLSLLDEVSSPLAGEFRTLIQA